MGRFTKNSVEGKPDEARSGWRARQEKARLRSSNSKMNRAEIAAIRAAHLQGAQAEQERAFNPEVQTTAAAADDFVTRLSDADLVALYKQLHEGRAPNGKAKRTSVERAVRTRQAELAAAAPVGEDNTEFTADELVLGGDDV